MSQRCGLVAVVGAPNAGKSTLVNALVGQKVAIVSPKAQTTRARLMGIAIEGEAQILLVDTPGIFEPNRRLDRAMVAAAWGGAAGRRPDRCWWSTPRPRSARGVERRCSTGSKDRPRAARSWSSTRSIIAKKEDLLVLAAKLGERAEARGDLHGLGDDRRRRRRPEGARSPRAMPEGPWHFPEDQVSDATDRMVAAEVTREQLYLQLHAELPYASAVETEKWEDRKDGSTVIHQQILVERDSQKAIVLGKGGTRHQGDRRRPRARRSPSISAARSTCSCTSRSTRDWDEDRGLYREIGLDGRKSRHCRRIMRARLDASLDPSTPSNSRPIRHLTPPAMRLSSKKMLPWLGSRLISSVCAPQ